MARVSKIASQPSQPLKATIHILESEKTSLSKNSERFENGKSTKSTTKSAYTYSVEKMESRKEGLEKLRESTSKSDHIYLETSLGQNDESLENNKSTKSTCESAHSYFGLQCKIMDR